MSIRFGPFDPLALIMNIINSLMKKGIISLEEAMIIVRSSLPPEMNDKEKDELLNSIFIKNV